MLEINEIRRFTINNNVPGAIENKNKYITAKPIAFSLLFRMDGIEYEEIEYGRFIVSPAAFIKYRIFIFSD